MQEEGRYQRYGNAVGKWNKEIRLGDFKIGEDFFDDAPELLLDNIHPLNFLHEHETDYSLGLKEFNILKKILSNRELQIVYFRYFKQLKFSEISKILRLKKSLSSFGKIKKKIKKALA